MKTRSIISIQQITSSTPNYIIFWLAKLAIFWERGSICLNYLFYCFLLIAYEFYQNKKNYLHLKFQSFIFTWISVSTLIYSHQSLGISHNVF